MIFAHGQLLPDAQLSDLLSRLESEINAVRAQPPLSPEVVISAVDALGRRLGRGEFDALAARYLPAGTDIGALLPLLRRETLEAKLAAELGPRPFSPVSHGAVTAQRYPLGTLLHIAPGNMPGLPVYSVVEGLLTGNVNLLKPPRSDKGLSLAALKLLTDQAPALAPYIYVFDLPSSDSASLRTLAALADGMVTWGGDSAIAAARALAGPGCKLIEWGHRLGFAYISGCEDASAEFSALAEHIITTGQRLCSSCQTIFLDSDDPAQAQAFCRTFLPYLEKAAAARPGLAPGAQATLSGHTARLERMMTGTASGELHFPGKGCSVTFRDDRELELSPMEGNVFVTLLPQRELLPTLRRQKDHLQTAGLICSPEKREALTALLARSGVTRVTRAGTLSDAFPGQAHDGEYPLARYTRVVDIQI